MIEALVSAMFDQPQQETSRDVFIRRYERVRFYSEIDSNSVDRVERILGHGEIIEMQSPGGDFLQSLRMAELVRERGGRVTVDGVCHSGCSLVWITARERLAEGFQAVTFHGTPISSLAWMRSHAEWVQPGELQTAIDHATSMTRLLDESGIKPWLFHCALRIQNLSHRLAGGPEMPAAERVETTGDYSAVWFPRSVLEAAGVRHLDRYDPPNERQRREIEASQGAFQSRLNIYWAQDGDCDIERSAIPASPSGELGGH